MRAGVKIRSCANVKDFWIGNNWKKITIFGGFPADVNDCAAQPCSNGGVCRDLDGDYSCQCPSPYVGKQCQLRMYPHTLLLICEPLCILCKPSKISFKTDYTLILIKDAILCLLVYSHILGFVCNTFIVMFFYAQYLHGFWVGSIYVYVFYLSICVNQHVIVVIMRLERTLLDKWPDNNISWYKMWL